MLEYYAKYRGPRIDVVPDLETLHRGITNHPDKIVVIKDKKIRGVAIYVTLSDETYSILEALDITKVDIIKDLLLEYGPNIHILMLAADSTITILAGIREIKRRLHPKTISWWNPAIMKLHKYKLRKE